jgi:general secretion pathway protein F
MVMKSPPMSRFRYKALSGAGELREGVQDGGSQSAVFRALRREGFWPVSAVEIAAETSARAKPQGAKFAAKDLASLFHEMAILLGSGIALDRALALLAKRQGLRHAAAASQRLLALVRDGASLSGAMAADQKFPEIAIGLVRAGEASGTLEAELLRLSDIMARTAAIRAEIISALVYPAILLATACLSIGVIMVVVVPEFVPLFDDAGTTPPLAFRFLTAASAALTQWGWLAVLALAASGFGLRRALRTPSLRQSWDAAKLRAPAIGRLVQDIETGRFCRTLGTLVKADVALPAAVALAAAAVTNTAMAASLSAVASGLREGGRLADRLAATANFSPDVLGLLRIGEESGRLGEMLLRQADISDANMRTAIARLLAIMVPAITIILGFIVAGIVTSLLVAMLSINDLALQ